MSLRFLGWYFPCFRRAAQATQYLEGWRTNAKDGVLIARLIVSGALSDADIDSIGQELKKLPERSAGKILLNLEDVEFVYSALLGKLLFAALPGGEIYSEDVSGITLGDGVHGSIPLPIS